MSKIFNFLGSTLGLKLLMSFSGIAMSLFLLGHVVGNLLILVSDDLYNMYGHAIVSNKLLLYTAEAGLLGAVGLHIVTSILLARRNRKARSQSYAVRNNTNRSRRTWMSSNMAITGSLIVIFIVAHIMHFKFGDEYYVTVDGTQMRDLATIVKAAFALEWKVVAYVVALIVIGMHLIHGFRSAWSTLGLETSKTAPLIRAVSNGFVVLVFSGFILIPIWLYFASRTSL